MQVAIARDYFPAYARLPRKAQRKADELLRKFTADPRQASLHYEPIRGAHDAQLRSLRVGDDYRAIVREPERGEVFLLLWIDHHDEAYRWAASKQTEVHPATGTLQLFDVEAATRAVTIAEVPAEAPRIFAAFSDEDLFHGGVPRALLPAVRAVASEGELDQLLPHLPAEAAEVLTGLGAGMSLDAALEETLGRAAPESAKTPPAVDPADVAAALQRPGTQQQFRVVDGDFDLDAALAHPLDVWRVFLHPKQRAIARARTKGPMRVTGGAGTGKTVVALHRAAFLVKEVYPKPDDRVLFTTFTVNLAHDVRRQMEKLLGLDELARVDVKNLDGWAADYLRARGEPVRLAIGEAQEDAWNSVLDVYAVSGFTPEFCKTEWRDVVQAQDLRDEESYVRAVRLHRGLPLGRRERRQLWPLFAAYRQELADVGLSEQVEILRRARKRIETEAAPPRYRAVLVDETQDLSLEALRLLRAIAGPEHPDDLFLVGDAHQRIYGRPVALGAAGINVRGRRSQELRLNYRTTASICRWSMGALGQEPVDDLDDGVASRRGYVSLREGQPPTVHRFDSVADETAFVVGEVKRLVAGGLPPEGIAVTARTVSPLRNRFLDALAREGIAADVLEREEPRHPSVRLATMHRIKGLEFPVVFVVGVNAEEVPFRSDELGSSDPVVAQQAETAERCLLHVAASRARDALHVTFAGAPSPFLAAMGPPPVAPPPRPVSMVPVVVVAAEDPEELAETESDQPATTPVHVESGDVPLDGVALPTRMAHWVDRKGLTTLRQLAAIPPRELMTERNLGRRSVAETRTLIEAHFGAAWEDVAAGALAPAPTAPAAPPPPTGWDGLRASLPEDLRAVMLDELPLTARLRSYVEREGLTTLAELAKRSTAELKDAPNVGHKSVTQLFDAVMSFRERAEARARLADAGLLASWKALLLEQDAVPRMVLTLRAGLGGRAEKLQQIGEMLGITRERVRQIELRLVEALGREGVWLRAVRARVDEALVGGAVPLVKLADDPWWAGIVALPEALDFFGERILGDAIHLLDVDEVPYLARCSQESYEQAWSEIERRAQQIALPAPLAAFRAVVEPHRDQVGETLAEVLRQRLRSLLHTEAEGDDPRVLGFGSNQVAAVMALLRASPTPLHADEIRERIGAGNRLTLDRLPEEALLLGHGTYGVMRHFPDWATWMERLVPAAVRLMDQDAPERQWLASELRAELLESIEIPEWLTDYHLSSLLRRSGQVRYLGRHRVSVLDAPDGGGRVHFHEELLRILRERGAPMLRQELVAELRRKTDAKEGTIALCLARPQFLRCSSDLIGLVERDLPGGAEALAEATEHVAELLERREKGLGSAQLWIEVSRLGPIHAQWTPEMCLSVVRGDARFRLSQSGAVGLASWENVRVPTRLELVGQCLAEGEGKVSVEAVQRRIEMHYGEPPDRVAIGLMANRFGAGLRGEWITREGTDE